VIVTRTWTKEPGIRVEGDRPLDASKVQAPGGVVLLDGAVRLFYTGVGPGRPFPRCQGYILSAAAPDGLAFRKDDGIRVGPDPDDETMRRRTLAPTVTPLPEGGWRMYFEARGTPDRPTVIRSARSDELVDWTVEEGIRLHRPDDVGGPRYVRLPDGRGRIYCFSRATQSVVSATTTDGLQFEWETGARLEGGARGPGGIESAGITAADVVPSTAAGEPWLMLYSAWQDVLPGTVVPPHPSSDPALADREDIDFAAASIAADIAGFRSRIFEATSDDGLTWRRGGVVLEGGGPGSAELDAVHAEDMSVVRLPDGRLRMYYAACDSAGNWRVLSAITAD
jgi:hypothetical protein